MRNTVLMAVLALTMAVGACASGPRQPEFTRADTDVIRKNTSELTAAFNAREVDKLLGFYAENSIFMPPNAPQLRGTEPLKSFYSDLLAKGATNLEMESGEVGGHGPIAYEYGTYSITLPGNGRDRGKYLRLLRNTSGQWRTEKTIWSSDLPPAGASAN